MFSRSTALLACSTLLFSAACSTQMVLAQTAQQEPNAPMAEMKADPSTAKKPLPSPAATAEVSLEGKKIVVRYNAPSLRGRKVMGGVVPYGQVWRTGANPATTLVTAVDLTIGTLTVPAGTYTIYTLPSADTWMLIVNKQTGQWGTVYNQVMDLGRTPMTSNPLPKSQEVMSISFENTKGSSTEMHIRWETTDESVTVTAH